MPKFSQRPGARKLKTDPGKYADTSSLRPRSTSNQLLVTRKNPARATAFLQRNTTPDDLGRRRSRILAESRAGPFRELGSTNFGFQNFNLEIPPNVRYKSRAI